MRSNKKEEEKWKTKRENKWGNGRGGQKETDEKNDRKKKKDNHKLESGN